MNTLAKTVGPLMLAGLSLAGCEMPKTTYGKFNGNEVIIDNYSSSQKILRMRKSSFFFVGPTEYFLTARDVNPADGVFEEMLLDGHTVEEYKKHGTTHPLMDYANQDSLKMIYNIIMEQKVMKGGEQ